MTLLTVSLVLAAAPTFAGAQSDAALLGAGRISFEAGGAVFFDEISLRLYISADPFAPEVDIGTVTIDEEAVGTSLVLEPAPTYDAGVAQLTNGVPDTFGYFSMTPAGGGAGSATLEAFFFHFHKSACLGGVDFKGSTIDRIEIGVTTFDIEPDTFTTYRLQVMVEVYGTPPGESASATVRLGDPPNPDALRPGQTGGPVLGTTWDPFVDHTSFVPDALADFLAVGAAPTNIPSPLGTMLCGATPPIAVLNGPGAAFGFPVPPDCSKIGATLCTQGGSVDPMGGIHLTNALDLVIGTH